MGGVGRPGAFVVGRDRFQGAQLRVQCGGYRMDASDLQGREGVLAGVGSLFCGTELGRAVESAVRGLVDHRWAEALARAETREGGSGCSEELSSSTHEGSG